SVPPRLRPQGGEPPRRVAARGVHPLVRPPRREPRGGRPRGRDGRLLELRGREPRRGSPRGPRSRRRAVHARDDRRRNLLGETAMPDVFGVEGQGQGKKPPAGKKGEKKSASRGEPEMLGGSMDPRAGEGPQGRYVQYDNESGAMLVNLPPRFAKLKAELE